MAYISEFRTLFHDLIGCNTSQEMSFTLEKWLRHNAKRIQALQHHRAFDDDFAFDRDELASWYALSRVNDLLIPYRPEQPTEDSWDVPILHEDEYSKFWHELQFTQFEPHEYHPFWCEIVEVETDENPDFTPQVINVFWPGLSFGDMMFARAGVRVRSGTNHIDSQIATTSPLYFSYIRQHRKTFDLSMGWGHNSQWSTDFRRDYVCGEHYLFNVDGKFDFDEAPFLQNEKWMQHDKKYFATDLYGENRLSDQERQEILVNRCFIRCTQNDHEYHPYDDCFVIRRDVPLW